MVNKTATAFLIALVAGGAAGCTSTPAGRVVDDSVITDKVKSALVADPVTKGHQININVETHNSIVQLCGFVDDAKVSKRAAQVARSVEGVKDVKNSLL